MVEPMLSIQRSPKSPGFHDSLLGRDQCPVYVAVLEIVNAFTAPCAGNKRVHTHHF